jgi:hypothetical protein
MEGFYCIHHSAFSRYVNYIHYVFHCAHGMCLANKLLRKFDLFLLCLKSLSCSGYLILNVHPVCPVYFILNSRHISWYTPLLSYEFCGVSFFMTRRFPNVLFLVKAIFLSVPLNNFVMNLVSFPMYVNLAHLRLRLSCFCTWSLLKFSRKPS